MARARRNARGSFPKMKSRSLLSTKESGLRAPAGSMQRMAVLAAVQTANRRQNSTAVQPEDADLYLMGYNVSASGAVAKGGHFDTDLHGNVNILLGGAMLSGVIIVVILICYCCHKNIRKSRPQEYSPYWRTEPDVHSLEVFTMDSHARCYERATNDGTQEEATHTSLPCPVSPGPPPAYESLIFDPHSLHSPSDKKNSQENVEEILPAPCATDTIELTQSKPSMEECRREEEGLPSYEAALKLDGNGYV